MEKSNLEKTKNKLSLEKNELLTSLAISFSTIKDGEVKFYWIDIDEGLEILNYSMNQILFEIKKIIVEDYKKL